ncbi:MAG: hypothetical protein BGO98_16925 [Myxococcales bacterium 68-20]|nr:MAG: hypothetical protein BGO98_16925 [Myxococcales bacterium 68-20]
MEATTIRADHIAHFETPRCIVVLSMNWDTQRRAHGSDGDGGRYFSTVAREQHGRAEGATLSARARTSHREEAFAPAKDRAPPSLTISASVSSSSSAAIIVHADSPTRPA